MRRISSRIQPTFVVPAAAVFLCTWLSSSSSPVQAFLAPGSFQPPARLNHPTKAGNVATTPPSLGRRDYPAQSFSSLFSSTSASQQEHPVGEFGGTGLLPVHIVDAMPEALPSSLHNTYVLLRHGQSTANVASIISSNRTALAYTDRHGITALGEQQGREIAAPQLFQLLQELVATEDNDSDNAVEVQFVASPFARTRQTAQACMTGLQDLRRAHQQEQAQSSATDSDDDSWGWTMNPELVLEEGIMERWFGRLDGTEIETYAYVWPLDRFNVTHTAFGVESVAAVCHRIRDTIVRWEAASVDQPRRVVVLVSHADTLQIAQLYAANPDRVGDFSSFRFTNGEVRRMVLGTMEHLPEPAPLMPPRRETRTEVPADLVV